MLLIILSVKNLFAIHRQIDLRHFQLFVLTRTNFYIFIQYFGIEMQKELFEMFYA